MLPRRHRFKFCICRAEKVAPAFWITEHSQAVLVESRINFDIQFKNFSVETTDDDLRSFVTGYLQQSWGGNGHDYNRGSKNSSDKVNGT